MLCDNRRRAEMSSILSLSSERHKKKHYFMSFDSERPFCSLANGFPAPSKHSIFSSVLSPDVVGLALDLVPAEVHVSRLVRAASSQPPALRPVLLPVTVHRGLARHAVASRPRGPPRSCDTQEIGRVKKGTQMIHIFLNIHKPADLHVSLWESHRNTQENRANTEFSALSGIRNLETRQREQPPHYSNPLNPVKQKEKKALLLLDF